LGKTGALHIGQKAAALCPLSSSTRLIHFPDENDKNFADFFFNFFGRIHIIN
jgi:hypothetical protein